MFWLSLTHTHSANTLWFLNLLEDGHIKDNRWQQ